MAGVGWPQKRILCLSKGERGELGRVSRSHSTSHSVVHRAQIVLASADGETNTAIARRFGTTNPTVCHWCKRWFELRLVGLYGERWPRRPRTHDGKRDAQLLRTVLESKPASGTHWAVCSAATATGLSKTTVGGMLTLFGIRPHGLKSFKRSTDSLSVDKVKDIVGLYLNPSDHAVVLCVDEKMQIQALERTQPVLLLGLGYLEGVTHDYVRHGTTTLFPVLDVAKGQVLTQCRACHRKQEFLLFPKHIEVSVSSDLDVHLVVGNYAAHTHPKVRAWLAAQSRFHIYYTLIYASWLTLVERWFGLITERQIHCASCVSAKNLVKKIDAFAHVYNAEAKPFVWTVTNESTLEKVKCLCKDIFWTGSRSC